MFRGVELFLKYLEIQGFKSFPDRVKIEFNKGITGVVGPNGSGKSNISDAIRWVMGEQSIKSLRGGKMEDVIFVGTDKRKPLGFAEVSMCFDNSDRALNVEYGEVTITRRFFRSGEGEYYINKNSCRLKDIHELFMDTGMGRDGYSVVGQGKIDEIITSKPEDRRFIFEEACGISKYRYRKAESEKKIQQTGENLVRLLDIINEIEGRIEPLRKESEKAKEFLRLKDELKDNEINLSIHNMDRIKDVLSKMRENLSIIKDDTLKTKERIEKNEEETIGQRAARREKEAKQESLNNRLFSLKSTVASLENEITVCRNSLEFSNDNRLRINTEIENSERKVSELGVSLEEEKKVLSQINEKEDLLNKKLEELNQLYESADKDAAKTGIEIDEGNNSILECYKLLAQVNADIASAKKETETLNVRKITVKEDIEIVKEDRELLLKKTEGFKKNIGGVKNEKNVITEEFEKKTKRRDEALREKAETGELISSLSEKLSVNANKKRILEEMERDMEGYNHSVKTLLKADIPGVRLYGTVSKAISVETKFATAIDAVLGNVLQNIITENEKDAKSAIDYLKKVKGGRATFLPVSEVRGRLLDEEEFKNENGYISLASKVVRCEEKFRKIADEILGRTLLMDTVENAIKLSRRFKYKYKIVTLAGEVINAGGAITGGNLGRNSSFLSRASQIRELAEKIDGDTKKIKKYKEKFDELSVSCTEYERDCEDLNLKIQQIDNEIFKLEYNREYYEKSIGEKDKELGSLEEEQRNTDERLKILSETENNALNRQREINSKIEELQKKLKDIQNDNTVNLSRAKEIGTDITRLKVDISETESDRQLSLQRIEHMEDSIKKITGELEIKRREISDTGENDTSLEDKIRTIKDKIELNNENIEETAALIEKVKAEKESSDNELIRLNEENRTLNEKMVALAKEQTRCDEKIARQEAEFGNINSRLWDEYELTYVTAVQYRREVDDLPGLSKFVAAIKNDIKALGNVNVNSIEEFRELKQRYDFLAKQKEDLENAKRSLSKIISDMESKMTVQFKEKLEIINSAFTRIFTELFNGGRACFVLCDEDDVLNSGIEIIAQPPGKKLQNMTLFSGGEKAIIAIAVLFSLLEVRPSPLCVLDEIEAALDDVNVNRFASYLRKISVDSQIAIITHRRGTMEEADVLYGVTMPEKGVSKILKLDINEIEDKILK